MQNFERKKYPKTLHVPWSKGVQSDDKVFDDLSFFYGKEVVVPEKLDGENTTFYSDYIHARSIDSRHNWTRDWVKKMHSVIKHDIPKGFKFVGENMFAEHAIKIPDGVLDGYFYLFSVWDDNDICISYDDMVEYAEMLDLPMPKVFYRGIFDEKILRELAESLNPETTEGYVIRLADSFKREDFQQSIAKYVREGHVQPDSEHWLRNAKQNGKLKQKVRPFFMG